VNCEKQALCNISKWFIEYQILLLNIIDEKTEVPSKFQEVNPLAKRLTLPQTLVRRGSQDTLGVTHLCGPDCVSCNDPGMKPKAMCAN
jgi:hypothetical protein